MKLVLPVQRYAVLKLRPWSKFKQDYSLILREFKHFPRIIILALVFSLLAAALEGIGIGLILSFLQGLTNGNAIPIQTGIGWFDIWFLGVNASVIDRLYRLAALILLATLLRSVFSYQGGVYTGITEVKLLDRLRKQIFEQLQALNLSYFSQNRSGGLINSITSELNSLEYFFSSVALFITRGSVVPVYLLSMLLLSWQLTLVSVLLFSLLTIALSTLMSRVREASFEISEARSQFTIVAVELINGIRTVHAFGTQDFERRKFYKASSGIVRSAIKSISAYALVDPLGEGIGTTILIAIIIVGIAGFKTPVAALLTFLFVLLRLASIVRLLNSTRSHISKLQGSLGNITQLLKTEDKTYFQNGNLPFPGLQQQIEFVSVDFGYADGTRVLHDVTLEIEKGQMTALVGASGAGKTTLAALISRFHDPTHGQILIDGIDLQKFEINSLRRKMAVVSQDTFIFNTSVRNNIIYGVEDADEAAIWEATRLANALEFILEMNEGFETQLGDRGVRLSGGQRQRIAIARALLRNPEILILDEATSALDSMSERLIQQSLEQLSVGRTVIAIAHRLSTIVRADKVIVLEQGRVVEQGSYQELLKWRGKLWQYHRIQYELGQVREG
ncbi:MAG TPA: heterocyst formation ABC transporter subunit HepA [Candidatus Caenarcaniphilales bacterium]